MFADNPDFFPTPRPLARKMLAKITNKERHTGRDRKYSKPLKQDCHPRAMRLRNLSKHRREVKQFLFCHSMKHDRIGIHQSHSCAKKSDCRCNWNQKA